MASLSDALLTLSCHEMHLQPQRPALLPPPPPPSGGEEFVVAVVLIGLLQFSVLHLSEISVLHLSEISVLPESLVLPTSKILVVYVLSLRHGSWCCPSCMGAGGGCPAAGSERLMLASSSVPERRCRSMSATEHHPQIFQVV